MSQFRCNKCNQLQFKYRLEGDKLVIETKCYACNSFSYFTIWLNKLNPVLQDKKHEKNNKY